MKLSVFYEKIRYLLTYQKNYANYCTCRGRRSVIFPREILGNSVTRDATREKKAALLKLFELPKYADFSICLSKIKCVPRIKILSSGSIFTTTSYNKSPKRINYGAFISDGNFCFIDNLICLESKGHSNIFLLGKVLRLIETFPSKTNPWNYIFYDSLLFIIIIIIIIY